jgi:hypothetical protein
VLVLSSIAVGCVLGGILGSGGVGVCAGMGPAMVLLLSSSSLHVTINLEQ